MKTKVISLLLALLLIGSSALALTSCGDSAGGSNSFEWPDSKLASLIPKPKSNIGEVSLDTEDTLMVEVSNVESKDYKAYVKDCKSKGFTVDYSNMDEYYSAENKDGYSLSLSYDKDKKTMSISLYAPSDEEESTAETKKSKSSNSSSKASSSSSGTSSKSKSGGVSPEFKKAMDEYESFMNDYVEFMKKYENSTDVAGMMKEYTDMMTKYSNFQKKIDDIDQDSLSADELAYYLEVTERVNKKLEEIGE